VPPYTRGSVCLSLWENAHGLVGHHERSPRVCIRNVPDSESCSDGSWIRSNDPGGRAVETACYEWWEKEGYFKPTMGTNKPKFVIVIPPPNVTVGTDG